MNKNSLKVISAILAISLAMSACGIASTATPPVQIYFSAEAPTATNEPPPDLYAGFTQNEQIPFVIIHPSGESLGIIGDRSLSNIEGVVWAGTNGNLSMVIYSDGNGKPKSAVVGSDVILYSNYTNETVDVTVVHEDGTSETYQAILDTELLNKISYHPTPSVSLISYSKMISQEPQQIDNLHAIQQSFYLLGAASCLLTVTGAALPPLAVFAIACGGTLLGGIRMYADMLDLHIAGLEDLAFAWGGATCVANPIGAGCFNALVTTLANLRRGADDTMATTNPPPAPATEAPAVTYATLCGWVENNSFTGALAPTLTIWETNQVVDLGALDSSKLRQFLDAGMPGYFQVFDSDIRDSFLVNFSYANKVNSCSQTQAQPPSSSPYICGYSTDGVLQSGMTGYYYPYIVACSTGEKIAWGDLGMWGSETYVRIDDPEIITIQSVELNDGTVISKRIQSWSSSSQIFSCSACVQAPTQPPAQSSISTQARISNEIYYAALRQSPGYSNKNNDVDLLANVPAGDIVQILDGPEQADGLNWWYVSWNGITGWMADHTGSGKTIMIFLP